MHSIAFFIPVLPVHALALPELIRQKYGSDSFKLLFEIFTGAAQKKFLVNAADVTLPGLISIKAMSFLFLLDIPAQLAESLIPLILTSFLVKNLYV